MFNLVFSFCSRVQKSFVGHFVAAVNHPYDSHEKGRTVFAGSVHPVFGCKDQPFGYVSENRIAKTKILGEMMFVRIVGKFVDVRESGLISRI